LRTWQNKKGRLKKRRGKKEKKNKKSSMIISEIWSRKNKWRNKLKERCKGKGWKEKGRKRKRKTVSYKDKIRKGLDSKNNNKPSISLLSSPIKQLDEAFQKTVATSMTKTTHQ
jgi:hypothetical protein